MGEQHALPATTPNRPGSDCTSLLHRDFPCGARPAQGPSSVGLPRGVRDRLSDEVIDELLAGAGSEEEIVGPGGVTRNSSTAKTLATEHGPVRIETPRDRRGTFEPQNLSEGRRIAVRHAVVG